MSTPLVGRLLPESTDTIVQSIHLRASGWVFCQITAIHRDGNPEMDPVCLVGAEGFEPPTLCSQSRCATRLRHAPCRPVAIASGRPSYQVGYSMQICLDRSCERAGFCGSF
jgi:hypothetical protein